MWNDEHEKWILTESAKRAPAKAMESVAEPFFKMLHEFYFQDVKRRDLRLQP